MKKELTQGALSSDSLASVKFGELVPARFLERKNRFVAHVAYRNGTHPAHLANPGRLEELLVPGRKLWLHPVADPNRKTRFDVVLVELPHGLVSVNSQLPNYLVVRALRRGRLTGFEKAQMVKREVKRGQSRIDAVVSEKRGPHWVEVKSVTLVVNGTAMFPDAPTRRGARHLRELYEVVHGGEHATVIFVIQREDAQTFAPNRETDPDFAAALRAAADAGVHVRAFRCKVTQEEIQMVGEIPVRLDSPIS